MIFGHIKMKFKYKKLANEVIDLEISALQKLKKSIDDIITSLYVIVNHYKEIQ